MIVWPHGCQLLDIAVGPERRSFFAAGRGDATRCTGTGAYVAGERTVEKVTCYRPTWRGI